MIRSRFVTGSWCVGLILTGCTEPAPELEPLVVRDSAGVRIVESGVPQLAPGSWTVSTTPDLVIGADEDSELEQLYRVEGAVALSDGRVVVLNAIDPIVRWFGSDGEPLGGAGRLGDGPGEFGATISTLWLLDGDSVGTWEHTPRRMHVFGPDREYARSVVLEVPPDVPYPQIAGRSDSHFVTLAVLEPELGSVGSRTRGEIVFLRYSPDGAFERQIMTVPGFELMSMELVLPGGTEPRRLWGRSPFAQFGWHAVHDGGLFYGTANRFEIGSYDFDGVLTLSMRKLVPNRPVTSAMVGDYVDWLSSADAGSELRQRPAPEDMPFPDSLPAHGVMNVDREGRLWVKGYTLRTEATATWSVFDQSGRWITDLEMPSAWRVTDIGPDYLLAVVEDELEVERVMRFPILRDEDGGGS